MFDKTEYGTPTTVAESVCSRPYHEAWSGRVDATVGRTERCDEGTLA